MRSYANVVLGVLGAFVVTLTVSPRMCNAATVNVDVPTHVVHKFGGSTFDGSISRCTMVAVNGYMYGTTTNGGTSGIGSIFRISPLGQYQVVYSFSALPQGTGGELGPSPSNGSNPAGPLASVGGVIYGTTVLGGFQNRGVLYSFDVVTNRFSVIHQFKMHHADNATGAVTDGTYIVGTVEVGGEGTTSGVYYHNISTGTTKFKNFEDAFGKAMTFAPPVKWGSAFVGVTTTGGSANGGTVYSFVPNTEEGTLAILHEFSGIGADSSPVDVRVINDTLYGVTGSYTGNSGELFSLSMSTSSQVPNFSVLHQFANDHDASTPMRAPVMVPTPSGQKLVGLLLNGGTNGYGAVYTSSLDGSNYSLIHAFNGSDSGMSCNGLVTGSDGNLYGIGNPLSSTGAGVASIFRMGPQIATVNPMHISLYNDGHELAAELTGSGFSSNAVAMMDGKPLSKVVVEGPTRVTMMIPSSHITSGAHVFTLFDPNIGNTSNTIVMLANQVRVTAKFGVVNNVGQFSQKVTLTNSGYGTAYNVHLVSAEIVSSNGSRFALTVPSTSANLTGAGTQGFTVSSSVPISSSLSPLLIVRWAYSGGIGSSASRLSF